jgi:hypothetical protein
MQQTFATAFATSFEKASVVKESFGLQSETKCTAFFISFNKRECSG